jgi:hypothetical protein
MDASFYGILKKYTYSYRILFYSAIILLPFTTMTSEKLLLHLGPLLPWKILLLYHTKNILSLPSTASFSQKNVIDFYDFHKNLIHCMSPFKLAHTVIQPSLFSVASQPRGVFCLYYPLFHCVMFWLKHLPKHTIFWNRRSSTFIILHPTI